MILRIWHAPVRKDDVEPFQAFMRETLYPALDEHEGCLSITTALDETTDPPRVAAVSTWQDRDAINAFGSDEEGVFFEEAHAFLAGDPTVEHRLVLDRLVLG